VFRRRVEAELQIVRALIHREKICLSGNFGLATGSIRNGKGGAVRFGCSGDIETSAERWDKLSIIESLQEERRGKAPE